VGNTGLCAFGFAPAHANAKAKRTQALTLSFIENI